MEPDDNGPAYEEDMDSWAAAKLKNTWEYEKMQASDCKEMNKALIKRFMSLLDSHYHVEYTQEFIKNPLVTFKAVFRYYSKQYGGTDKVDQLENEE